MSQTASADNDGDAAEQIARTVAAAEEQRLDGTAVSVTEPGGELSCRPRFRELLSLLLIVVIADVTLYRGQGFAGPGLFFIAVPVLLLTGVVRSQFHRSLWLMGVLLLFLAARLLWCGSLEAVFAGAGLLCGFIMSLSGRAPWLLQTVAHTAQLIPDGYVGLSHYYESLSGCRMKPPEGRVLAIVLPALTVSAFATLFLFANPDLLSTVSAELTRLIEQTQQWLREFAPGPMELLFWITTGWIATGALRPSAPLSDDPAREMGLVEESTQESSLFPAWRNTLISVIGLFALYLLFEFQTLWGRVFPPGFHYSGYAHEGAAWLTVALALATALLSIVFRGRMLSDPRLSRLKRLAWLWSLENLLLAIAVYHRLWIYTGFNGMTRMRVVGLLGMTSVVAGFVLVVWKINRQRSFRWLIRRQLWTVAFALYLYCVLPVDGWVQYYNVSSILSGQPAPSVQIVAHETSDEGWLQLEPLLTCEDVVIREGVSALLADRRIELELAASLEASPEHWTARQFARERLRAMLNHHRRDWPDDAGAAAARRAALERFREYAMQWY